MEHLRKACLKLRWARTVSNFKKQTENYLGINMVDYSMSETLNFS